MATAEQVKALIDSHRRNDDARFRAVAMQIAARSAKQGKTKLADELRALIDSSPRRSAHVGPVPVVPIHRPSQDLAGLLTVSRPETKLAEMVLPGGLRADLERVVSEYHQRERLRSHGLAPIQRLLLIGHPGCGKTMTASALAGECHLPLMVVQLHNLITKFMGETAVKLHLIFESMNSDPGVYFFDEFDAIGSIRDAKNEVGEIRRVLNSFLQFIETNKSDSIVVAATNLLPMLDNALFRRFDAVLRYRLPAELDVRPLIENRLTLFDTRQIGWKKTATSAKGLSHADVVRAAEEAAKEALLAGRRSIRTADLVKHLSGRRNPFLLAQQNESSLRE